MCVCVYTHNDNIYQKTPRKTRLIKFVNPCHLKVVPTQKTHCQQCPTRLRGGNIIPKIIVNTVESGPSIEARSEKDSYVTPPWHQWLKCHLFKSSIDVIFQLSLKRVIHSILRCLVRGFMESSATEIAMKARHTSSCVLAKHPRPSQLTQRDAHNNTPNTYNQIPQQQKRQFFQSWDFSATKE